MIVSESSVILSSQHSAYSEHRRTESLSYWTTDSQRPERFGGNPRAENTTTMPSDSSSVKVSLSEKDLEQTSKPEEPAFDEEPEIIADLNIRTLRALIERLTGRKIPT